MLTIVDVEEIELNVKQQAARWESEFQERYHAPILRAQLVIAALSDPAVAEKLQRENPREFERIKRNVLRMRGMVSSQ